MLEDDVHGRRSSERHAPGEHVVEQHAERIDVAALVGALAAGLLRRDVVRRPHEGARVGDVRLGGLAGEELHQAEVEHLHEVVIVALEQQHDVRGFQIAMDDTERVRLAQRSADLLRDVDHPLLRERPVRLHDLGEGAAVQELHRDEEDAVVRAPVIVERDGVRVRQLGGDAGLEEEPLVEVGVAVVPGAEDLESHDAIERCLQCLVNAAHSPMANHLEDPVSIVEDAAEKRVRVRSDGWEVRGGLRTRHGVSLQSRAEPPGPGRKLKR